MGTVKVPRAREAPIRAWHSKVTEGPSQLAKPRGPPCAILRQERQSGPASRSTAPLKAIMPLEAPWTRKQAGKNSFLAPS